MTSVRSVFSDADIAVLRATIGRKALVILSDYVRFYHGAFHMPRASIAFKVDYLVVEGKCEWTDQGQEQWELSFELRERPGVMAFDDAESKVLPPSDLISLGGASLIREIRVHTVEQKDQAGRVVSCTDYAVEFRGSGTRFIVAGERVGKGVVLAMNDEAIEDLLLDATMRLAIRE